MLTTSRSVKTGSSLRQLGLLSLAKAPREKCHLSGFQFQHRPGVFFGAPKPASTYLNNYRHKPKNPLFPPVRNCVSYFSLAFCFWLLILHSLLPSGTKPDTAWKNDDATELLPGSATPLSSCATKINSSLAWMPLSAPRTVQRPALPVSAEDLIHV